MNFIIIDKLLCEKKTGQICIDISFLIPAINGSTLQNEDLIG
jgi:hypothetical protein